MTRRGRAGEGPSVEHRLTVQRTARYFTVGRAEREVWFVLHGYGQLAERFLREFEPLADGTRLVVAPEALSRFYVDHPHRKVGATWMTREDRLVEIQDYVRYLDALYHEVFGSLDRGRVGVHVLGFSQGCATAARWLTQGAARADRLILWGGEVPPDLELEPPEVRERLNRLGLTLVVGSGDEFITPKLVARDTGRLDRHGVAYRMVRYAGGHEIVPRVLRELASQPA